jgi:hypothetical protein
MPRAWHIIAETEHLGGEPKRPPSREYFLVAMPRVEQAVQSLRMRQNLLEAKLAVVGEATLGFIDRFGIKDGEIISLGTYS